MADVLFDLSGVATPLFGEQIRLDQTRVHQQVAWDGVARTWYFTQVIANGVQLADESAPPPTGVRDARGDLAITRVDEAGARTGVMYVRRFDHGAGLAVENEGGTAFLWLAYDAQEQEVGTNAHGRKLVRLPFTDGAIVDVGAAGLDVYDPAPDAQSITASLDAAHGRMAIAYNAGSGTQYRIYDLAKFRARDFSSPLAAFARPSYPEMQSWALYGDFIYQVHGSAYGPDNPAPPLGTGDAWWTVLDARTGAVVQRLHNTHSLGLPYREPESVTVRETASGPQLVFGFATSDTPPRLVALFGISSTTNPGMRLYAEAISEPPGIQLTVSLGEESGVQSWTILRQIEDLQQPLFSGTGASLPSGSTWVDDAPPGCIPLAYVLSVQREDGRSETAVSNTISYEPPGGCGGGGGRVVGQVLTNLGCATKYTALIHWRGGARPYDGGELVELTDVKWGRTINDVSEASATVLASDVSSGCWKALKKVAPWVHELTLYRDSELVWQGPITRTTRTARAITFEAKDVFAWFDKLVNTYRVTYTQATPDELGRRSGNIVYIARNHIRLNMTLSSLNGTQDYAGIMDYIVAMESGLPTITVEKDGSSNRTVWTAFLGDILREWTKRGLAWTTVGRSLVLRGKPNSSARAQGRLTLDDFLGDVEIITDGEQAATYGFATTQQGQDISDGKTVGAGRWATPYGRLDALAILQEEKISDAELRGAAWEAQAGRYPAPVTISVPDGAQVSPEAPVTVRQLVPGERFDVFAGDELEQGFILSDVETTWQNQSEKVAITLVPLADIDEELSKA